MTVEEFATSGAVDWDKDFIWVQKTSLLKVLRRDAEKVEAMRHDGVPLSLNRSGAEAMYFEIRDGTYLKPIYAPCVAHILSGERSFDVGSVTQNFPEGSAILRHDDTFTAIHQKDLMRDHEAVSDPSDKRFPEMPFSR